MAEATDPAMHELTVTREPVASLRTYHRNPRQGDVVAIRQSLVVNGQYKPLVANRGTHTGRAREVLAGNHTLKALRDLSWPEVAVCWVDVDDDQAARIVAADNRTADLGDYDERLLAELLGDLPSLEGTGYDEEALARIIRNLDAAEPATGLTDPDDVPEAPEQPFSKPGDLWLLGEHRLLCGDATSRDDVARLMNGQRAALMATDPPYLVDYDGSNHPQSTKNTAMTKDKQWDDYKDPTTGLAFYIDFIGAALAEALTEGPVIYQWHADLRRALVVDAWEHHGLLPHQTVIWVKPTAVLTRSDFMWQHEPCLYGWRRGTRPPTSRRPPANEPTVWQLNNRARNDIHPTQKPVEIFGKPIAWHIPTGEIAYEPFSGSGSQLIAAHQLGRRCYAMEIAPQYVDVACRRWQEHVGQLPVLEATGEPHDFTTTETTPPA